MSRKKLSTTVYLTAQQDAALKLLHGRTKEPVAVYIRDGIDLILEKHGVLCAPQPTDERDEVTP